MSSEDLPSIVAGVVSAYVSNNNVDAQQLPGLIGAVFSAFRHPEHNARTETGEVKPAVPIRRSVSHDAIHCLECGMQVKMLRSHLRTCHQHTPESYRQRWKLPVSYPMVAPGYSDKRASIAKQMGLGTRTAQQGSGQRKA